VKRTPREIGNSLLLRALENDISKQSQQPTKSESWSNAPAFDFFQKQIIADPSDRRVSFDDNIRVVLIPSRKDYDGLVPLNTIWWTKEDYSNFITFALRIKDRYGNLGPQDDEFENDDIKIPSENEMLNSSIKSFCHDSNMDKSLIEDPN